MQDNMAGSAQAVLHMFWAAAMWHNVMHAPAGKLQQSGRAIVSLPTPGPAPLTPHSRVDKAKAVSAMLERKRKRGGEGQEAEAGEGGATQAPAAAQTAADGPDRPTKAAKQRQGGGGGKGGDAQPPKQQQQQQRGEAGGAAEGEAPGGVKVLRTYGQRRPKADPVTDAAAPTLSKGLLQLIAGKKGKGGGGAD